MWSRKTTVVGVANQVRCTVWRVVFRVVVVGGGWPVSLLLLLLCFAVDFSLSLSLSPPPPPHQTPFLALGWWVGLSVTGTLGVFPGSHVKVVKDHADEIATLHAEQELKRKEEEERERKAAEAEEGQRKCKAAEAAEEERKRKQAEQEEEERTRKEAEAEEQRKRKEEKERKKNEKAAQDEEERNAHAAAASNANPPPPRVGQGRLLSFVCAPRLFPRIGCYVSFPFSL
jgi:outer membrane biosynthesis protein TonB